MAVVRHGGMTFAKCPFREKTGAKPFRDRYLTPMQKQTSPGGRTEPDCTPLMQAGEFADRVRRRLLFLRKTAADLAAQERVPLDTLRTWLKNNRFPRERALSIATRLELATDLREIVEYYEVDFTKLGGRPPKAVPESAPTGEDSCVIVTIGDISVHFAVPDPGLISSVTAAIKASLKTVSGDLERPSSQTKPVQITTAQVEAAQPETVRLQPETVRLMKASRNGIVLAGDRKRERSAASGVEHDVIDKMEWRFASEQHLT